MRLSLLFFLFFFFSATQLFSQPIPMKFGKVDRADLEMKIYEKDSGAEAVVLCDYGNSYFRFNESSGFQIYFDRHVRIKILNKNGYNFADHSILVYDDNNFNEKVTGLKGYTYNLVDGKIIKDKLKGDAIFKEEVSEYWSKEKFSMPNVQEGSVIEYSYTIVSDYFFNLRPWEFQKSIPVIWSEYRVKTPEFYNYKHLFQGYEQLLVNDNNVTNDYLTLTETKRATGNFRSANVNTTRMSSSKIDYLTNTYRWCTQDMPALREEPFMSIADDYVTKIDFELVSIKYPNKPLKLFNHTWEELTEELSDHESFGKQLKKVDFIKNESAAVIAAVTDSEQAAKALFEMVRSKVKWNNIYHIYADNNLKKAYDKGSGSSADINLLLTALLKENGFQAEPVILSTRNYGKVNPFLPLLTKFNHVICLLKLGEKNIFLDATDRDVPFGVLPANCLNGRGRLIAKDSPQWVSIQNSEKLENMTFVQLNITEKGKLESKVNISNKSHYALIKRAQLRKNGPDDFLEEASDRFGEGEIMSHEFKNENDQDKPFIETYRVSFDVDNDADILYTDPMIFSTNRENPFKNKNRKFPVDFPCPIKETYITNITIPEGYLIDEFPENTGLTMPDNACVFKYSVSQTGNIIQVRSELHINNTIFLPEQYPNLMEFFNRVAEKNSELIVLKKDS